MNIRPFADTDLPRVIDLTIETFRPFYEGYVASLLGDELFQLQHGNWEQDYRDDLPTLHRPADGRFLAVGEIDGVVAGFVSWRIEEIPNHGQIYLLAVMAQQRRKTIGHQLCTHAIEQMKGAGIDVVEIGTGDDAFHAPARALYEGLGFTKIPIAGYLMKT